MLQTNDPNTEASLKQGLADAQALFSDIQSAKAAKNDKNDSESSRKSDELKRLGNEALANKDFDKAVDFYSQAINIDTENAVLYSST